MRTVTKDQLVKIVAAAMIARNQADKLLDKTKRVSSAKFPGSSLLNFQTLDGTLTKDNYYGPNVVAALKWYLQKSSDPHVPLAAAKYDHIAVTWAPPSLYEPAKPATAAAVPTPKPAPKPATQSAVIKPAPKPTIVVSKPAPTLTSKPAPSPAPAPAPKPSSSFSNLAFPAITSPQLKQIAAAVKPIKAPVKKPAAVAVQKAAPKPPAYGQEKVLKTNKIDAEDMIAQKAAAASTAAIQKINQKMIKAALQKQATSEHKNINKELAFKRAVLQQLNSIQKKIADRGGPSTALERRIVGLVI